MLNVSWGELVLGENSSRASWVMKVWDYLEKSFKPIPNNTILDLSKKYLQLQNKSDLKIERLKSWWEKERRTRPVSAFPTMLSKRFLL